MAAGDRSGDAALSQVEPGPSGTERTIMVVESRVINNSRRAAAIVDKLPSQNQTDGIRRRAVVYRTGPLWLFEVLSLA
jgi:hypothetical protein